MNTPNYRTLCKIRIEKRSRFHSVVTMTLLMHFYHEIANKHATPRIQRLVSLARSEDITKLIQWTSDELRLLPQVGSKVSVCVADSDEGSLEGILKGLGGSGGGSVNIVDTSELEKTLDSGRGDETGTARSWDKLEQIH